MKRSYTTFISGTLLVALLFLGGCSDSDDNTAASTPSRSYEVSVTNLTNNQPLSPIAAILHDSSFLAMTLGEAASAGLEVLAESGDNSTFLSDADTKGSVSDTTSGLGVILPGAKETLMLSGTNSVLTVVSMLVNTNDALLASSGIALGDLGVDEVLTFSARVYDAGTEGNSEAATEVPGPAGGGEGFNADRNDRDFIITHPGTIGLDGGLSGSTLDESHRFDNPVARVVVKRIS